MGDATPAALINRCEGRRYRAHYEYTVITCTEGVCNFLGLRVYGYNFVGLTHT